MLSCPPQLRPRTSVAEPMNCWPVGSSAQCASEIDRSLPSFSVPQPLRRPTKVRRLKKTPPLDFASSLLQAPPRRDSAGRPPPPAPSPPQRGRADELLARGVQRPVRIRDRQVLAQLQRAPAAAQAHEGAAVEETCAVELGIVDAEARLQREQRMQPPAQVLLPLETQHA